MSRIDVTRLRSAPSEVLSRGQYGRERVVLEGQGKLLRALLARGPAGLG